MAWSATRTPGDVRGRVGAAALVHQAINRAAAAAILTREPAAREFQSEGHSAAVLLCCGCGQRCTTAMQIHGSPPNRLRSCESGGGRDTLETVGPAAYSTETASTMGRGHRVCECNMLHVHAVRLVSHTRCRGRARGAPAVVVAWAVRWRRGSRDDPDSESFRTVCVRYRTYTEQGSKGEAP